MDENKNSKGTNLEKLKRVFEAEKNNKEAGAYNWWRPQFGINTVRILPASDPEEVFFYPTARHKIDEDYFYCLKYHTDPETGRGEKCPVCETRKRLFRSGDPTLIRIAKDIKAKKQFLMNLIDRASEDPAKVFIFAAGVKINDKIVSSMLDDDIDITDVENGYDFIIKKEEGPKTENGQFPSYDNSKAKRQPSSLHDDSAIVQKILDARNDLKSVPRFDSPEALQNAIDSYIKALTEGGSKGESFYEDENKPAESAAPQPSQKAKASISDFKKKLQDSLKVDDEEDDGDEFPG